MRTPSSAYVRVLRAIGIALVAFFAAFPIYWMLNTALASSSELASGQDAWPHVERVGTFLDFVQEVPILMWLGNSTIIAGGQTILSMVMALGAAYALSRFKFRGKNGSNFLLFSTQMLPEALVVVPLFALFSTFGLLNSLWGLVLVNTAFVMPVAAFIIKGAIDAIPYELEESARVDGSSTIGIVSLIVFPLVAPSVAAGAVLTFFDGWGEFLFANTFLRDPELSPASVGLASLIGEFYTPMNGLMVASLVFTIPPLVFFMIVQKKIVTGLTAGSVKG